MEFRDLKKQYQVLREEMDRAVFDAMASGAYIMGPQVRELEQQLAEYVGVKHCLTCANGTDALTLALKAWGIGPGDAVFVPDFTFFSSAEVVPLEGATPVFVDVCEETFNIDSADLERAVKEVLAEGRLRPRVVVAVDLFGLPADYQAVRAVADKYGLLILEDGAQGFGGSIERFPVKPGMTEEVMAGAPHVMAGCDRPSKRACSFGDIATTSFFPAKPLGCYGDGGALFTNDDALAAQINAIANHGMVVRYHHELVGVNSRLDSIQAAILDAKLPHLNEYTAARQAAAAYYDRAFANHPKMLVPGREKASTHVFHQYTLRLIGADRDRLKEGLAERHIPAMVYYPIPLHLQKAYQDPRYKQGDFPVAERLAACVLSLPMHTCLDEEQLQYITRSVLELIQ